MRLETSHCLLLSKTWGIEPTETMAVDDDPIRRSPHARSGDNCPETVIDDADSVSADGSTVIDDADSVSADGGTVSSYAGSACADADHLSDLKPERSARRDQDRNAAARRRERRKHGRVVLKIVAERK